MPNVDSTPAPISTWRKIAIGTWSSHEEPTIHGTLEIDMSRALPYIEKLRAESGVKITVTHLVIKAMANGIRSCPELNAYMGAFKKIYLRKNVDIFCQVVSTDESGHVDLSGVKISNADRKTVVEIAQELYDRAGKIRKNQDAELKASKGTMSVIPTIFVRPLMKFLSFLMYSLNLDMRWAGLPKDGFGCMMITNVGMFGVDVAYAPLVPYSRVPSVILVGEVKQKPVAVDGKVEIHPILPLSATFDHRFLDGVHIGVLCRATRKQLENPEVEMAEGARVSGREVFELMPGAKKD